MKVGKQQVFFTKTIKNPTAEYAGYFSHDLI